MSGRIVRAMGIVAVLAASYVLVQRWRRSEPTEPGAGRPAAFGDTIESLGPAPSLRVLFDPAGRGRVHSGGSVSDDWGRTWQTLMGPDGSTAVLLGGRRAVTFAFGPDERLLLGEALLESPGTPLGLGRIARAVEWNGSAWKVLGPVDATPPDAPPQFLVRGVGYLAGGTAAVALPHAVWLADGRQRETPGSVHRFLAASDETLYVAVEGGTTFPLYCARAMDAPWLPVGGVRRVGAMTEGSDGTVFLAAERLGRARGGVVEWDPNGMDIVPTEIVAHSREPLLAAWGRESRLLVSRDNGRSFLKVRWGELRVAWAAFDPRRSDSLLVVDREGAMHRLSLTGEPRSAGGAP